MTAQTWADLLPLPVHHQRLGHCSRWGILSLGPAPDLLLLTLPAVEGDHEHEALPEQREIVPAGGAALYGIAVVSHEEVLEHRRRERPWVGQHRMITQSPPPSLSSYTHTYTPAEEGEVEEEEEIEDAEVVVGEGGDTATVAYTIGNAEGYDQGPQEGPLVKLGPFKTEKEEYEGGWVWASLEDARRFVAITPLPWKAGIYRLQLSGSWEECVSAEPHPSDGVHRLLKDAKVLFRMTSADDVPF